ncbi:Phosphotyrosyl phosphatase activator [Lipomyces oligophaga]|uniref:Phosphotyrosyl phosphatase activator n=1 Tax=Lipomyces oligophaga TaxID=45792 RepID=UPI0034CEE959
MSEHQEDLPHSRILTKEDLEFFRQSETYKFLLQFILDLREAANGRTNSFECEESESTKSILLILTEVESLMQQYPPVSNAKSRFGNPAFRDYFDAVEKHLAILIPLKFPTLSPAEVGEVSTYLINSLGNRTRIDYGSGHELNFICFLLCLDRLGIVGHTDYPALVLRVFVRYIALMRKIQTNYWLEPAGSHGVWGLDDYHFLPFLFGAAQLSTHKHLRPKSIHNSDIIEMYAKDYMYLNAIAFINSVKTASLRWSSPMLDDISAAKSWTKVSEGMVKMYTNEVLGKVPIMQHFLFGKLLPLDELPSEKHSGGKSAADQTHAGHIHQEGWGDCCGIKVPSSIAASQMNHVGELRTVPGGVPRPIPFD